MLWKRDEIFRAIDRKEVEVIQRRVKVDYDNGLQSPLSFFYQGREHKVSGLLGRFKGNLSSRDITYLVKSNNKEVYLLCLHFHEPSPQSFLSRCYWILHFRVFRNEELMLFSKEERKMKLVNIQLKRAADFHGYLCPDLVIGYKAYELAFKVLSQKENLDGGLIVIAENTTGAVDAIQCLSGCTLGNQRLKIHDFGKHNYTFLISRTGLGVKLSLRGLSFGDEQWYLELKEKVEKEEATIEDFGYFQRLLDDRIKRLLYLKHEELFETAVTKGNHSLPETFTAFARCHHCGEPVLKSKLAEMGGVSLCRQCFSSLMRHPGNSIRH
ncbi:MAG: FmdE family protein [Syntrophales bacterium]